MALWSFEPQFRALDRTSGQPYYWTNCYYWLQDDTTPTPLSAVVDALNAASWYAARPNNVRQSYRIRCNTWAYDVVMTDPQPGAYGPAEPTWFIPWVFYIRGYDADNRPIAYKRLRGCWSVVDVDNNQMVDALYNYLRYYTDHYLAPLPLCNVRGYSVVRWEIERTLRNWQQRHGSKRAARVVFA